MHWTLALAIIGVVWAGCAYWRPVSLALALAWMVGQAWWITTGDQTPTGLYWFTDAAIIVIGLRFLSCWYDIAILALFPFAWFGYTWSDPVQQWWFLSGIMLAQLFLAGPLPGTQKIGGAVSHGPLKRPQGGLKWGS